MILKLLIFFPEKVKLGCLFQSQELLILSVVREESIVVLFEWLLYIYLAYQLTFFLILLPYHFHCLFFLYLLFLCVLFMLTNLFVHLFDISARFVEFLNPLIVISFDLKLWVHLLELHHLGLRLLSAHRAPGTLLYL